VWQRTFTQARPTCRLLYLHVITHNDAALAFYARQQFSLRKHERSFYIIKGELAPVPGQVRGSLRGFLEGLEGNALRCALRVLVNRSAAVHAGALRRLRPVFIREWWSTAHARHVLDSFCAAVERLQVVQVTHRLVALRFDVASSAHVAPSGQATSKHRTLRIWWCRGAE
jgi:hypothetical protein